MSSTLASATYIICPFVFILVCWDLNILSLFWFRVVYLPILSIDAFLAQWHYCPSAFDVTMKNIGKLTDWPILRPRQSKCLILGICCRTPQTHIPNYCAYEYHPASLQDICISKSYQYYITISYNVMIALYLIQWNLQNEDISTHMPWNMIWPK